MRKDDSSLELSQFMEVRKNADALLRKAGAYGRFPTPVDDILHAANLVIQGDLSLEHHHASLLSRIGNAVVRNIQPTVHTIKDVLGLLHVPSGEVFLDQSQHENRKVWIKLHETGHGILPHQCRMYGWLADGDLELKPEIEDSFEREANNCAAELLYQLDAYQKIAADYTLSIKTPIDLSKKFGGSIYASMRRYANTHFAQLALAVYDKPKSASSGEVFALRRKPMASSSFTKEFGEYAWPNPCSVGDVFLWQKLRARLQTEGRAQITNLNGETRSCQLHTFNNGHEIFALVIPERKLQKIFTVLTPPYRNATVKPVGSAAV